jgi:hypothetical protein
VSRAQPALTDTDRYRISQARKVLATAKTGDQDTARTIGRLEVVLEQLLDTLDEIENR